MAHDAEGFQGNNGAAHDAALDARVENLALNAAQDGAAGQPQDAANVQLVAEANAAPGGAPADAQAAQTVSYQADAQGNVHLPDGTELGTPKVVGTDLEFIQPDGHVIIIPNGAVTHLTIYVGNVEVPPATLDALLQANGIQPAEGPGGNNGNQSGHGNFTDATPGGLPDGIGIGGLLPPNPLSTSVEWEYVRYQPRIEVTSSLLGGPVSEGFLTSSGVLSGAMASGQGTLVGTDAAGGYSVNGLLSSAAGTQFRAIAPQGLLQDAFGNEITSLGETIGFRLIDGQGNETVVEGWTNPTHGDASRLIFRFVVQADGHYTFSINDQLDDYQTADAYHNATGQVLHAFAGEGNVLDLDLSQLIQASHGGQSVTGLPAGTVVVPVLDDAPSVATPVTISVDETGLPGGNPFYAPGDSQAQDTQGADAAGQDGHLQLGADALLPQVGNDAIRFGADNGAGFVSIVGQVVSASETNQDGNPVGTVALKAINGATLHYVLVEGWDAATGHNTSTLYGTWSENAQTVFDATNPADQQAIAEIAADSAFKLDLDQVSGNFHFTLLSALQHDSSGSAADFENNVVLDLPYQMVDNDGDKAASTITITINDDSPSISGLVAVPNSDQAGALFSVLDETVGTDRYSSADNDNPANAGAPGYQPDADHNTAFGQPGSDDGAAGSNILARSTTQVSGGLEGLLNLGSAVNFGADGPGSIDTRLSFTGLPAGAQAVYEEGIVTNAASGVATNLTATGQSAPIELLFADASHQTLIGVDANGHVAFSIALVADGSGHVQLQTTLYEALNNTDANAFDAEQVLKLASGDADSIKLHYSVTVTDADGDSVNSDNPPLGLDSTHGQQPSSADLTLISGGEDNPGYFTFQDDAPVIAANAPLTGEGAFQVALTVDETVSSDQIPGDRYGPGDTGSDTDANTDDGVGLGQAKSAAFSQDQLVNMFGITVDFGSDGPGANPVTTQLAFTGLSALPSGEGGEQQAGGLATNLFTTDGHQQVFLFLDGNGNIVGMAGGTEVLSIAIDHSGDSYQLVSTLYQALDNGEDGNAFDSTQMLSLAKEAAGSVGLQLIVTATDGDGDHTTVASNSVPLISTSGSGFAFQDDGPVLLGVTAFSGGSAESFMFDGFVPNNDQWGEGSGVDATGISGGWNISWADGSQGAPQLERVGAGFNGMTSPDGATMVDLDASPGNVALSQALNLVAGQVYTLTFEVGQDGRGSEHLQVFFGGEAQPIYDLDDSVNGATGMHTVTLQITGGTGDGSNLLVFKEVGTADDYGTFLANVQVSGASVVLDDEDVANANAAGNQGGMGDDGHGTVAAGKINFDAGSDGLGRIELTGVSATAGETPVAQLQGIYVDGNGVGAAYDIETVWNAGENAAGVTGGDYAKGGTLVGYMDVDGNEVRAFTVEVKADGSYTITMDAALAHPAAGTEDNLALSFGFNLYDGDGDHVSGAIGVDVDDDSPVLNTSAALHLTADEDDIATSQAHGTSPNDGNADGSYTQNPGDNQSGPATVSGQLNNLVSFGADGRGSFGFVTGAAQAAALQALQNLGLTSESQHLSYQIVGDTLVAYVNQHGSPSYGAGDREVFSLKVTADGHYAFSLYDNLDHVAGQGQNTTLQGSEGGVGAIQFGSLIQATDGDGDPVTLDGLVSVTIRDDVPVLTSEAKPIHATVDEDDISTSLAHGTSPNDGNADGSYTQNPGDNQNGPADVTGTLANFVNFGADGHGSFGFVSGAAADTALQNLQNLGLTSHGQALSYQIVGDTLVAYLNAAGSAEGYQSQADTKVFSLEVTANGQYSFALYDSLDHIAGQGQNTSLEGEDGSVGSIQLGGLIQATDGDGDSITLDGLLSVTVRDDVPTVNVEQAQNHGHTVELGALTLDESIVNHGGDSNATSDNNGSVTTPSFITTPNSALAIGIVHTPTSGPGTSVPGLFDVSYQVGADGGSVAYAYGLVLSDGSHNGVKTTLSVTNLNGHFGSSDRSISLFTEADGSITGRVGGAHGDVALHIAINPATGQLTVEQYLPIDNGYDNPSQLDETALLKLVDGNDSLGIKLTATVTDGDGDVATSSKTVAIVDHSSTIVAIQDDGPSISTLSSSLSLMVDETAGSQSHNGLSDHDASGAISQSSKTDITGLFNVDYGTDGKGSISYALSNANGASFGSGNHQGTATGLYATEDSTHQIYLFQNGNTIEGRVDNNPHGDLAFSVTLDSSGKVQLTQYLAIEHDNTSSNDEATSLSNLIHVTATATDGDGDSTSATSSSGLTLTFYDDGPSLNSRAGAIHVTVDEDDIATSQAHGTSPNDGNADGSYTLNPSDNQSGPATVSGDLGNLVNFGADGEGSFGFVTGPAQATALQALHNLGLTSEGDALSYQVVGNALIAYVNVQGSANYGAGDREVFSLSVTADGHYAFSLYDNLDHVSGQGQNTSLQGANGGVSAIQFGDLIQATDGDGDPVTLNGLVSVTVRDDVPTINTVSKSVTLMVDETAGAQTHGLAADHDVAGALSQSASVDVTGLFGVNYGADGAVGTTYALTKSNGTSLEGAVITGLHAVGSPTTSLVLHQVGNTVEARIGSNSGPKVFDLTIDATGHVQMTQYLAIMHADGSNPDDVTTISNPFYVTATATDGDGDVATATSASGLTLTFYDDGPTVTVSQANGAPSLGTPALDESIINHGGDVNATSDNNGSVTTPSFITTPNSALAIGIVQATAASVGGLFNVAYSTGADGGSIAYNYALALTDGSHNGVKTTLSATNLNGHFGSSSTAIYLYTEADGSITGRVGGSNGSIALHIAIDHATGALTIEQYLPIAQGNTGSPDEANLLKLVDGNDSLGITLTATVTDGDGDKAIDARTVTIIDHSNSIVSVEDDGPTLVAGKTVTANVDEDGLAWANADATPTARPGEAADPDTSTPSHLTATGSLASLVDFGTDGPGANGGFTLKSVPATALAGVTSQGGQVYVVSNGSTLTGYVDADGTPGYDAAHDHAVFTLTLGANGNYTFSLIQEMDQPAGGGENSLAIDLSGYVTATDGDGDSVDLAANSFKVSVLDDIPVVSARASHDTTTQVQTGTETHDETTTETVTDTFALQAGNQSVRGIGSVNGHDLVLTALDGFVYPTVNTSNGNIGVDNQWIDGSNEVLIMSFETGVGTPHPAADQQSAAQFKIDVNGSHSSAAVFIDATHAGNFVALNFTVNGQAYTGHVHVVTGAFGIPTGYVLDNVPDGAVIGVAPSGSGASFDTLSVSNYNGVYTGGHYYTGTKFAVSDIQTSVTTQVTHTVTTPVYTDVTTHETLVVSQDESAGVNTAADPNAADDTANTPPAAIFKAGAIGYAESAVSVLSDDSAHGFSALFTGSVGADIGGGWSFAITDANGNALSNAASGLTTLDNTAITLSTAADGTLVGSAGGVDVFKVYVDTDGHVWIAQYQAIHNGVTGSDPAALDDIAAITADLHIKATLTDGDGDPASAVSPVALTVQFQDDGPVASDMSPPAIAEGGAAATGTLAFVAGTDGATLTQINGTNLVFGDDGWSQAFATAHGTLQVKADGSYQFAPQGDDVYKDAGSASFSFTVTDGDGDTSSATATFSVDDTPTAEQVVLTGSSVSEGPDAKYTFTATLADASQGTTSVTILDGNGVSHVISIADGAKTGSIDIASGNGEDVYNDASSLTAHITGITGGNFENPAFSSADATATVNDTLTPEQVVLTGSSVSEGPDAKYTFTAALVDASQGTTSVTILDGNGVSHVISIADGAKTGSIDIASGNGEDPYKDPSALTAHITSVTGGNFEDPSFSSADVTATVADTITATTINLSGSTTTEGPDASYVFTATLSNASHGDTIVVTDQGIITIANGQTTGTLTIPSSNGEDPYKDASQITATITSASNPNFESLVVGTGSATAYVNDTITATTVSLSGSTVTEGPDASYVFTATLSNASHGDTTVVTDQGIITIANGQTTGTLTIPSSNGEDAYKDASQMTATITSASNPNFESLVVGTGSATAYVNDTVTATTISLYGSTTTEGPDASYVFTATLSNASHGDTMVVTDQGIITISDGQTSGTLTIPSGNTEDAYKDASQMTATITSASNPNFESLVVGTGSATAYVNDTITATTISLSGSTTTEGPGASYVFTATLSNASHGNTTVVTDHGSITIADGQTSGTLIIASGNGEDVYKDASQITVAITGASNANFESMELGTGSATAYINDTTNIVAATLSAGAATFGSDGSTTITYTVTLSSPDGLPVAPGSDVSFTLQTGQTVVVHAGATSGHTDVTFASGSISGTSVHNSITGVIGDGQYEDLVPAGTTDTVVNSVPTGGGSVSLTLSEAALDTVLDPAGGGIPADLAAGVVTGSAPGSRGETDQATSGITFNATGEALTVAFANPAGSGWSAPTVSGLASGYSLSWTLSGGQLIGHLVSPTNVDLGAFVQLSLNGTSAAAGSSVTPTITATLVNSLLDAPNADHVTISGVSVVATDTTGDKAYGSVNLTVTDDTPIANAASVTAAAGPGSLPVKAALVVDFSKSISNSDYALEVQAIKAAGDKMFDAGNASISVIIFAVNALALNGGNAFTTKAAFDTAIDALANDSGRGLGGNTAGTNYVAAIQTTMTAFHPDATHNNQVIFISDGEPSSGEGLTNNATVASQWNSFVNNAGYDLNVTAVGVGSSIGTAALQSVDVDGNGNAVTQISGFSDLLNTLVSIVPSTGITGTVIGGAVGGTFGADGGHVQSITVNGVTYAYDSNPAHSGVSGSTHTSNATSVTVSTTEGGTLVFYFVADGSHAAGSYTYTPPTGLTSIETDTVHYVLVDNDGDTAGNDLNFVITPPPVATADHIITNAPIANGTLLSFAESILLANDSDGAGYPLHVTSTSNLSGLNAAGVSGGVVTVTNNSDADWGSLTYTVSDGHGGTASATATISSDTSGSIDGTSGNDILIATGPLPGATQTTTIGFNAGGYDVGDVVSITLNGHAYNYTVTSGHTTAEQVFDGLQSAIGTLPTGVTWLSTNLDNSVATLAGAPGTTFTVAATTTDVAPQPWMYTVDFANVSNSSSSFDNNDVVRITINGTNYDSDGSNSGNNSRAMFDDAQNSLASVLQSHGFTVSHDTSQDSFTITMASSASISGKVIVDGNTAQSVTASELHTVVTDQPDPSVHTSVDAPDGFFLSGGDGNDMLIASATGSDTMTGGTGGDTFVINAATLNGSIHDVISDYSFSEGDKVDLSSLLNNLPSNTTNLADHVSVTQVGSQVGTNTYSLNVDTDGAGGSAQPVHVADVTLADTTHHSLQIIFDDSSNQAHTVTTTF